MAEQNELISAEIDIETYHALASVQDFARAVRTADQSLKDTDATIKKTETSLASFDAYVLKYGEDAGKMYQKAAEAAEKASEREVRAHETARKQIETHNARLSKEIEDSARRNTRANEEWANSTLSVIAAYGGFAAIRQVLSELDDQQRKVLEGRDKLVAGRLGLDEQLRSVIFNLGLPMNAAGQEQARQLMRTLTQAAPGATIEQAAAVAGASASFNLNVGQAGADQQTAVEVLRSASRAGLDPETSGNLIRLLVATRSTNPQAARGLLSQLEAAAAKSPVEQQAQFVPYGLRATLPLINQGLGLQESFGLYAAAAGSETSPRVAATAVQSLSRVFRGDDDKGAASLFQQAVRAGLLDQRQFSAIQGRVMDTVAPGYQSRINNLQSTIADATTDLDRTQHDYDRDMAEIMRKIDAARSAGKQTESLTVQLDRRKQTFETRQRELGEQVTRAQQSLDDINRTEGAKVADKFGSAAWRSIPFAQRYQIFRTLAEQAQSPEQLQEFLRTAGATSESLRSGINILSGGGPVAQAATIQAMTGARAEDVDQRNREFATTNVAQNVVTQNRIRFQESATVGTAEERNRLLVQESESRMNRIISRTGDIPEIQDPEYFKANVFRDDLVNQFIVFYRTTSDNERRMFPAIEQIATELSGTASLTFKNVLARFGFVKSYYSHLQNISVRFFRVMDEVNRYRRANPNVPRIGRPEVGPDTIPPNNPLRAVPFVPLIGQSQQESGINVGPATSGLPGTSPAGGASGPTTQPATSGALGPQSMINYNVSIGTVVSGGSDVLNTVGRLTASENA
jgi:hypothetical protein